MTTCDRCGRKYSPWEGQTLISLATEIGKPNRSLHLCNHCIEHPDRNTPVDDINIILPTRAQVLGLDD